MHMLFCSVPTLAVSAIYCLWYHQAQRQQQRTRVLHQRVAYMLWVMASHVS